MLNDENYIVYIHINKINNKKYIGISSDVKKRWANKGKNYYDQVFGLAIQKYGWDNFEHKILYENLSKEEACKKEQELIKKYKTTEKDFGYNRSEGGDSGSKGAYDVQFKRMKPVYQYDFDGNFIKYHISIASAVREICGKNSTYRPGNISLCCKGKRLTALGYRWFYEFQGYKIDPIKTPLERTIESESIVVYQYDLEGNYIRNFKSIAEAERKYGKGIGSCCNGITKTSHGFQWFKEYKGEKIDLILSTAQKFSIRNPKKVYVYDLNLNYIGIYPSQCELERRSLNDFGILLRSQSVSRVCTGERKQYKGYIFSFTKLHNE